MSQFLTQSTVRAAIGVLLLGCLTPALPQTVIKLGTLAPEGSPWHEALQSMGERWRKISGGQVKVVIYPGGVLGDEPDMVNKMRIGQIQAAGLSGAGLSGIEPGVMALQIPMMFDSYAELDYVRERVAPHLEKMMEARGYLVLNWGDVGWVHFFTTRPATRLGEMRNMKLFTWAGDNDTLELWKANGFRAVPLAATDILTGLQTGLDRRGAHHAALRSSQPDLRNRPQYDRRKVGSADRRHGNQPARVGIRPRRPTARNAGRCS